MRSKGKTLTQIARAQSADRQRRFVELKRTLTATQEQLDALQAELAQSSVEDEVRRREGVKRELEITKTRWEIRFFRAKAFVIPVAIATAWLKSLLPSAAAPVSSPTARDHSSSRTSEDALVSSAERTAPQHDKNWLSGRFREKYRRFVDLVEKLYKALEAPEELKDVITDLEAIISGAEPADAEPLDRAAAHVVDTLRSEEIRNGIDSDTELIAIPFSRMVQAPTSHTGGAPLGIIGPEPINALRQAVYFRQAGIQSKYVKRELAAVCRRYLSSVPTGAFVDKDIFLS